MSTKTRERPARRQACSIAAQITRKGDSVLGLATGSTPIPAYEMLVQWYDRGVIDFDRVRTFNLDEYVGIDHKNPLSYHAFMQEHLFSKVNLRKENVHLPSGNAAADVEAYDKAIHAAGGIDIQLLGIGRNGHIGFNEPADDFTYGTHVVTLTGGHHRGERPLLQERGRGAASGGLHGHRQHHGGQVRRAGGDGREQGEGRVRHHPRADHAACARVGFAAPSLLRDSDRPRGGQADA